MVATAAARARSAEGITTNGSLPPSSRTDFLMASPATRRPTAWPAGPDPVRVTATTRSSRMTASTRAAPISRVWKQPSGKPARSNSSCMNRAHCGTFDACFSRPTLPAIRAGAANRMACHSGKFQGITASTGPSGCQAA